METIIQKNSKITGTVSLDKEIIMFEENELKIIHRALSVLSANYDEYDLDHLHYSEIELEAEIEDLFKKIHETYK